MSSRFYRDLHDRELLSQATSALNELIARNLIDVFLPEAQASSEVTFPRRVATVAVKDGRLFVQLEKEFFASEAQGASAS